MIYKTVGDVELVLDIYHPKDFSPTDRRPAIVFFHGGPWSGGWKTHFSPQCHYLASRGMVAITAEYRVSSRHKTHPSHRFFNGGPNLTSTLHHADRFLARHGFLKGEPAVEDPVGISPSPGGVQDH